MNYKPTYIQKGNEYCVDIKNTWGIVVQETPYNTFPEPKEYTKRDWPDEDGDDIYIPPIVRYQSYTQQWKFLYIGDATTANDNIHAFLSYLQGSEFSIFSEYTLSGCRGVYSNSQTDKFLRRDKDYFYFTVDILVNKPLSKGVYIGNVPTTIKAQIDTSIYWSNGTVESLKKGEVITTPEGLIFGVFVPNSIEPVSKGVIDGIDTQIKIRRTLSGVTDYDSAVEAITDMELAYGEFAIAEYMDEDMEPTVLLCIGANNGNPPIPIATLKKVSNVEQALEEHIDNKAIHKTSQEIRDEITEEDIPETIARLQDLNNALSSLKGNVSTDYDTLYKIQSKIENILTLLNGDNKDDIIETLEEALGFINEHKEEIDSLVNTYIKKASIVDNLTTDDNTKVLAASQGIAITQIINQITKNINESLGNKVDKIEGKQLSSNDYTDVEKTKLEDIEEEANKYILPIASSTVLGGIKIGDGLIIDNEGIMSVIGGGGTGAILLDTTLNESQINAQMSNILQAFLKNPTIQVVIKANVPIEEGTTVSAWFNYVMINHQEQVIDETNTQHWLVLTAGATMNATSVYIGITATAMNGTVANTNIQISNTPFITNDWNGIESGIPSDTDNFLFNDGADNKKISTEDLVDKVIIPNVKIGGYNYLINSSLGNAAGWTQWQGDVSFVEDEGVSVLRLGPIAGGLYSSEYNGIFQNNDTVLSLEVKCETTGNASIGIGDYRFDFSNLTPEMGWVRRSLVIPKDETLSELQLYNHEWGNNQGVFRIKNIQLEIGNIPTDYSPKPAPFVDYTSLDEQIVLGEFWLGEDGTSRQVYCRTFKGTLSSDETYTAITGGIWNAQIVQGYINENNQYNMPFNLIHATSGEAELNYLATMYVNKKSKILIISYSPNSLAKGADYVLTVKYTKA